MTTDQELQSPPSLGTGPVNIGPNGVLDLHGCPLTIAYLKTIGARRRVAKVNGMIEDLSTGTGVTVLTVDSGAYGGNIDGSIRLVKAGAGNLDLGWMELGLTAGTNSTFTGGTEIDGTGEVVLESSEFSVTVNNQTTNYNGPLGGSGASLVVNSGTLDLNGFGLTVGTLDGSEAGAVITSYVSGTATLTVGSYYPSLFAGKIEDGNTGEGELVGLVVDGQGAVTLTGDNTYTGGTSVNDSWLQVGDGTSTVAQITGPVYVNTQNGLIFDVAASSGTFTGMTFDGAILASDDSSNPNPPAAIELTGSVLKTGPGNLLLHGSYGLLNSSYAGAMRVDEGTLTLGDSGGVGPEHRADHRRRGQRAGRLRDS